MSPRIVLPFFVLALFAAAAAADGDGERAALARLVGEIDQLAPCPAGRDPGRYERQHGYCRGNAGHARLDKRNFFGTYLARIFTRLVRA